MIQLFLDGKEVVTQSNTSIKLIRENPFFTKAGSSTFSIIIPMHVERNIKVLGHINRLDYKHKTITFSATLKAGNKTLITGEAIIIEVTEVHVKVQLLGGTSLMNFYNKMEHIFIDELDLGKFGMANIGDTQASNVAYPLFYQLWIAYINDITWEGRDNAQKTFIKKLFGLENEWVAFPIYNETSSILCNDWIFRAVGTIYDFSQGENGYYIEPRNNIDLLEPNNYPQVRFVVQPYLLPMIERIFNALGYSIDISSLSKNELFSKIFIASSNESAYRNKALPHWSVNDFITQLEYFFGATFDVDEETKNITIMRRSDYINRGFYCIDNVIDEFNISNEEDQNALSTSNIGYEEVEPFSRIESWILENSKHKYYATYPKFLEDYLSNTTQDYYNRYKGYIIHIEDSGLEYICKNPNNLEGIGGPAVANFFKNKIVKENTSELDVTLKIVPVNIVSGNGKEVYLKASSSGKDVIISHLNGQWCYMSAPDYPVRTWEEAATTEEDVITDVEAAINGEEPVDKSKDDLLRVAINTGAFSMLYPSNVTEEYESFSHKYPKPTVFSEQQEYDISGQQKITAMGLNLCDSTPEISLATEVYDAEPVVNTDNKYCIKFISTELLDPGFKFLIRNQMYLCEKLEFKITDAGVEKLVTGYFYRLEE